jgi:hypothetical protein
MEKIMIWLRHQLELAVSWATSRKYTAHKSVPHACDGMYRPVTVEIFGNQSGEGPGNGRLVTHELMDLGDRVHRRVHAQVLGL